MEVPKLNEQENKALDQASLDLAVGVNHVDISPEIKEENKTVSDPIGSLYLSSPGGYTKKDDLKSRAGLGANDSWTEYLNNGGTAPHGYEIESRLLAAEERRQGLYEKYQAGGMSESDFLFEAYGRDYMKTQGQDLGSVSYWYNRMSQGMFDSPLDNEVYLKEVLDYSRELFKQDEKVHGLYEDSFSFKNGDEMTEESFREYFGQQYTDEYVEALGGYAAMMSKYQAGLLSINPFIDANMDGKIDDGDYYYHDDGRVYKIGTGCQIKQRDADGNPSEVHVGEIGIDDAAKTFFVGLGKGLLGIGESIMQLTGLVADVFNGSLFSGEFKTTKKWTEETEKWKNSVKIGDMSVFNDNIWTADGVKSTANNAYQIADTIGTISGMMLTTVLTANFGNWAAAGQSRLLAGLTKEAGKKVTYKEAIQLLKKQAIEEGKKGVLSSAKYTLYNLASSAANIGSKVMGFSQGVINTPAKSGVDAISSIAMQNVSHSLPGLARSAASAAVLTTRDIVDNIARSAAINDSLVNEDGTFMEEHRTGGQIFGDAVGIGVMNFGISTVLRATWDDIGLSGRVAELTKNTTFRKITGFEEATMNKLFRYCNSTSRVRTLIDTFSDGAEYVITTLNNQFATVGGLSKGSADDWGNNFKEFFKSPAAIIGLTYSSYATYKGSIGQTNFGARHQGFTAAANDSINISKGVIGRGTQAINEFNSKPITDQAQHDASVKAAETFLKTYAEEETDRVKLIKNFGLVFSAEKEEPEYNNSEKIIWRKGSCAEAKDGDLVFALNPSEGEHDIRNLPQIGATMINVFKLKNKLGKESSGFVDDAIKEYLDGINVNALLQKNNQVYATIALQKEFRNTIDKELSSEKGIKRFFNRLKEPWVKKQTMGIFDAFKGTKWANAFSLAEEPEEVAKWIRILNDPESLFRTGDWSQTFKKRSETTDSNINEFFIAKYLEDVIVPDANGNIDMKNLKEQDKTVLSKVQAAAKEYNISPEQLAGLSYKKLKKAADLGEEWNTKVEKQEQLKKMNAQALFLSKITAAVNKDNTDKTFGGDRFFVMNIPDDENKPEYYFFVTPSTNLVGTIGNKLAIHDALVALDAISVEDIEGKREGLKVLIQSLTGDPTSDKNLTDRRTKLIIDTAIDSGLLGCREALSLARSYFSKLSKADEEAYPLIAKLFAADKLMSKIDTSFSAWVNAEKRYGKVSMQYKNAEKEFAKAVGDFEDADNNPAIKLIGSTGLIAKKDFEALSSKVPINFRLSRLLASEAVSSKNRKHELTEKTAEELADRLLTSIGMRDYSKDILDTYGLNSSPEEFNQILDDKFSRFINATPSQKVLESTPGKKFLRVLSKVKEDADAIVGGTFDETKLVFSDKDEYKDIPTFAKDILEDVSNSINNLIEQLSLDPDMREEDTLISFYETKNQIAEHIRGNAKKGLIHVRESSGKGKSIFTFKERLASINRLFDNFESYGQKVQILNEIKQKYPVLASSLDYEVKGFYEGLARKATMSTKSFVKALANSSVYNTELSKLSTSLVAMSKAMANTEKINTNNRLVVDLTSIKSKELTDVINAMENDLIGGSVTDDDALKKLEKQKGGSSLFVRTIRKLGNLIQQREGKLFLEFDMANTEEATLAKDFFDTLGYEWRAGTDYISHINGVHYNPNSDRGFIVKSNFDSYKDVSAVELKNLLDNKGKLTLDARQNILNLKMNEIFVNDDSLIDPTTLAFVLSDFSQGGDYKIVPGSIQTETKQGEKAGKVAGNKSDYIPKTITGLNAIKSTVNTEQLISIETLYSIRQAFEVAEAFFAPGKEQNREEIKIDSLARQASLYSVGFEIDDNRVVGFKLTDKGLFNAFNRLKKTGFIGDILPLDQKVLDYVKANKKFSSDVNIYGQGINLMVDQEVFESKFDNRLAATLRNVQGEGFDTFARLGLFDGTKEAADQYIPVALSFDHIDFAKEFNKELKISKVKEIVANKLKEDPNNFFALQIKTALEGLTKLSDPESKTAFLAEPSICNAIFDNIEKSAKEIVEIVSNLKFKPQEAITSKEISIEDLFKVSYKQDGVALDSPYITSDVADKLGIRADKETFEKLKAMVNEDIIEELRTDEINLTSIAPNTLVIDDIDSDKAIHQRVDAVLNRTRYVNKDNEIEYHISTDDLAILSKEELNELFKLTKIDSSQKKTISNTWNIINGLVDYNLNQYKVKEDDLSLTAGAPLKTPRGNSLRDEKYIPVNGKNRLEKTASLLQIQKNRAYKIASREAQKIGRTKLVSLATKFGDEQGLQYNLNKYFTENAQFITNDGNRTIYNMQNRYQAAKVMYGYANLIEQLETEAGIDKDNSSKLALDIIAKTTGVGASDEYEGTFFVQNKDGNVSMDSAIRVNRTQADDTTDTLLQYFRLRSNDKRPNYILLVNKDAGVESGNINFIEVTDKVDKKLVEAFYTKTYYNKLNSETPEQFWEKQIPRVRVNKYIVDKLVEDLGLPETYANVFRHTALKKAEEYKDNYASLSIESIISEFIDDFNESNKYDKIDRTHFNFLRNKEVKAINDVLKFGVSHDYLPDDLKGALDFFGKDLASEDARKAYLSDERGDVFTYHGTIDDYALAKILNSKEGADEAFILRAIKDKHLDTARGTISSGYDKWADIRNNNKPFMTFDLEWIYDNYGNKYITQIAFQSAKYVNVPTKSVDRNKLIAGEYGPTYKNTVVKNGKQETEYYVKVLSKDEAYSITFDVSKYVDPNSVESRKAFSQYEEDMTKKLMEDWAESYSSEELEKKVKEQITKNLSSKFGISKIENSEAFDIGWYKEDDVLFFINKYILDHEDKYFLSYNGKGDRSDIATLETSDLKELLETITPDNHIDGLNDLTKVVYPRIDKDNKQQLDYMNLSNVSVYKQLFPDALSGDKNKAHNADFDIQMTTDSIAKLFQYEPTTVKPQMEEFKSNLKDALYKRYTEQSDRDTIDNTIDTIIANAYNKIKDNKGLLTRSSYDEDFIDKVNGYKTLTNENLRKAMNALNSFRISQDLKLRKNLMREVYDKMITPRIKPVIETLVDYYDKGREVLSYIVLAGKKPDEISTRFYATQEVLIDMFGHGDTSLSKFDNFVAFAELLRTDRLHEFFNKLNASEKLFSDYSFSVEDMEKNRAIYTIEHAKEEIDKFKINNKGYNGDSSNIKYSLDLLNQDPFRLDENNFLFKVSSFKDLIDFDNRYSNMEYDKENSINNQLYDYIEASLTHLLDDNNGSSFFDDLNETDIKDSEGKTPRELVIDQLHTYFSNPSFMESLEQVIEDEDMFTRAWSKATPIDPLEPVEDINGEVHQAGSDSIVMSNSLFRELFNAEYNEVIEEYQALGQKEICVMVLRQPSDKPGTLHPFKVIVTPDERINDKSIRLTDIAMFSKLSGDFDGDHITVFRTTPEESFYLNKLNEKENESFKILDQIYAEAIKFASTLSDGEIVNGKYIGSNSLIKSLRFPEENKALAKKMSDSILESLDYIINNKGTGFRDEYQRIKNELSADLEKAGYSEDEQTEILNTYFLKEKQIGLNRFTYLCDDSNNIKLNKAQRKLLREMEKLAFNASAESFEEQSTIASDTGFSERVNTLEKISTEQGYKYNIPDDLKYRSITISKMQEALLRQYFESDKNKAERVQFNKILEPLIKEFTDGYKDVDNFTFEDFMMVARLIDHKNNKEAIAETVKDLPDMYKGIQADIRNKVRAREFAFKIREEILERYQPERVAFKDNVFESALASEIVKNLSDRIGAKTKNIPHRGLGKKWIIYPIQEGVITSNEVEKIVLRNNKEGLSYKYAHPERIKVDNADGLKVGTIVKKGATLGTKTLTTDSLIVDKFDDGTVLLLSLYKNIAIGSKLLDKDRRAEKEIVGHSSFYDKDRIKQVEKWIKDMKISPDDVLGYGGIQPSLKKAVGNVGRNDYKVVTNDQGKVIGVALRQNMSVIENVDAYNATVGESSLDYYTYGNNVLDASGTIFFGGYFIRNNKGNFEIDTAARVNFKNMADTLSSKLLGLSDGKPLYQRLVIYTLATMKGSSMPKEVADNYIKYITQPESGTIDGLSTIREIINKYYNKDVATIVEKNIKEAKTDEERTRAKIQKALLDVNLFTKVAGLTYSGIESYIPDKDFFSKSNAPSQAIRQAGIPSLGYNSTTNFNNLVSLGKYNDNGFISKLTLMNVINNALGRGIVTDLDAIMMNRGSQIRDTKDATVYVDSSKFGTPGQSNTIYIAPKKTVTDYDIGNALDIDDKSYYDSKEGLYRRNNKGTHDYMNRNADLLLHSGKSLKTRNLFDFFTKDKETAYDNIRLMDSNALDRAFVSEPHMEYRPNSSTNELEIRNIAYRNTRNNMDNDKQYYTPTDILNLDRSEYKNSTVASVFGMNRLDENTAKALSSEETTRALEDIEEKSTNLLSEEADSISKALDNMKAELGNKQSEVSYSNYVKKSNLKYRASDGNMDSADAVTYNALYPLGLKFMNNAAGSAAANAVSSYRYYNSANLSIDRVVTDQIRYINDTVYNADLAIANIREDLRMSNDSSEAELNRFIAVQGLMMRYEELNDKDYDNKYEDTPQQIEAALSEWDLDLSNANDFLNEYSRRNPRVVNGAMALLNNQWSIINSINNDSYNQVPLSALLLISKADPKSKRGKEKNKRSANEVINSLFKSSVGMGIKGEYTFGEITGGQYVNFLDNMSKLSVELAKTQSVYRAADKLPKSNTIKYVIKGIVEGSVNVKEDGTLSESSLAVNSNTAKREYTLGVISDRLLTSFNVTKSGAIDYINAINKVENILKETLSSLGLKEDITLDELQKVESNGDNGSLVNKAIDAYTSLYELYSNVLATSPDLLDKTISYLKTISNSTNVALVDRLGRKINPSFSDNLSYVARKPVSGIDFGYIRDAIIDCSGSGDAYQYNLTLAVRALMGEVFTMDSTLANQLDKHIFTKKIPGKVLAAIQKASRWCSKMLMSNPLKLARRVMQFSLYDFNMAITANPKTVAYMPQARKDLSAFFQSKGAVCSPELKDYLEHQGFKYSDIAGYDPVQMETTGDSSLMDRAYFDKVNNVFTMQNLFVRYALYRAELEGFKNEDPYYGAAYHNKKMIDGMTDDGDKAMQVLDTTLGGPGGFSELSKTLGQYGFVFTTFPLAVARWGTEGAATAKAVLSNMSEEGPKNTWRHLGSPLVTMGVTYGLLYVLISAVCNIFDVDEEDAEEMAKNQEFIDPINTILNDSVVSVDDNSIFQLQAIVDAFDSFREEEKFGNKILGLLNDNFFSHFNPILKAGVETMFGKDLYGGTVQDNDYSFSENAERKLLGYLIGSAGSNALIKEKRLQEQTGEKSTQSKITAALAAELGNTKAYKSERKSYNKSLKQIKDFLSSKYAEIYGDTKYTDKEGENSESISSLSYAIKQAIQSNRGMDEIVKLIDNAISKGYNSDEIRKSIKSISVIGKLETIEAMGWSDEFFSSLSDSEMNQYKKAVLYEQKYFPYVDDLLELYDLEDNKKNSYIRKPYYKEPYYRTNYRRRISSSYYDDEPYIKPNYYYPGKSQRGNTIPPIKDLFINRLTNTTGKKAISISDLIGEYYSNYYNDYSGEISGERYKGRKNKKQSQSDWRN